MPDVIDLSNESEDDQKDAEDAARKRIMNFAAAVNASKRLKTGGTAYAAQPPVTSARSSGQLQSKPMPDPNPTSPTVVANQPQPSSDMPPPQNSLLAELHAERMKRLNSGRDAAGGSAGASAVGASAPKSATSRSAGTAGGTAAAAAAPTSAADPTAGASTSAAGPRAGPSSSVAAASTSAAGSSRSLGAAVGPGSSRPVQPCTLKILTYNIWFKEEVALEARMEGLGKLIEHEDYPHVICLQEVTPNMMLLWQHTDWFDKYLATPPPMGAPYFTLLLLRKAGVNIQGKPITEHFRNSVMGRGVLAVALEVGGRRLMVATSHLESPIRGNMFTQPRQQQAKEAVTFLDSQNEPNTIWAGDMNWNPEDGALPLPPSWKDAWPSCHPDAAGLTYHCRINPMLTFNFPGKRLDRVLCKLSDFQLADIRMVGTQPLPGKFHMERRKGGNKQLPVLISDHFGLLATLTLAAGADGA